MYKYVVCIREAFLRDTQYLDVSRLSDEEYENFDFDYQDEIGSWNDFSGCAFVCIVTAKNENEACEFASEKYGYSTRSLVALEVI